MTEYSKRAIKKIRAALDSFSPDPALITLTYRDPESIRCINEMRQRVTDFIQRAGCNRDIPWIATCDVLRDGTEVHHHVVTQGLIFVDRDFIARCWEYGRVDFTDTSDCVDLALYLSKCVYVFGHYPERGHEMAEIENVDELIERLGRSAKEYAIAGDWASAEFLTACADAIKGQRTRAEEAEASCEFRDLVIKVYQDEFMPKYCALIERLKQELAAAQEIIGKDMGTTDTRPIKTCFGYPFWRVHELVDADRAGRCVVQKFSPGHEVWVVENDEDGNPCDVTGYVFVTSVNDVALVSPVINGSTEINDILREHVSRTAMGCTGFLEAYPIADCYESKETAQKALGMEGDKQ